ncbi:hypothetical protein SBD_7003 [Streptomyces bottropensis ATCC 25435]|uniref:Uncharacterized protein n=1 Tax=Streptomyces bottropensis ATCC 25435 TaxID=1054862 RepID=M3EQH9_9ACTN|nr:hypothetical protein SBD_7003 [Streptomyces bottropensis ATCC 25435]
MLTHLEGQESEIAAQAEATRGRIAELTAQLEEFDRVAEGVRITRKTLLALPDPTPPAAKLPDHPAYRQIMAMFAAADAPLRARAFCEAMDLCTRRRCGALGQRCVKRMTPLPAMSRSGSSVALAADAARSSSQSWVGSEWRPRYRCAAGGLRRTGSAVRRTWNYVADTCSSECGSRQEGGGWSPPTGTHAEMMWPR